MNHTFSEAILLRLQSHAKPLIDSVEDVIARALDALEGKAAPSASGERTDKQDGYKVFSAASPPSLTHATLQELWINGERVWNDVSWSTLVREVITAAARKGHSSQKILSVMKTPAKGGKFDGPGFRYIAEADLSFQQLNSDRSWATAFELGSKLGLPISIRWIWQKKDKAHLPGQGGSMEILP